jgi:hypothetical protein
MLISSIFVEGAFLFTLVVDGGISCGSTFSVLSFSCVSVSNIMYILCDDFVLSNWFLMLGIF